MLDQFNICRKCTEFVEFKAHLWRDVDGHSFSLISDAKSETGGFVYHVHSPSDSATYVAGKYDNLTTEVLSVMGDLGYESDYLGNTEDFGYYEFFPDFNAIVQYDSLGFVYSQLYPDSVSTQCAWNNLVVECNEFYDDQDSQEQYELEYDEYDSDLYDVYED